MSDAKRLQKTIQELMAAQPDDGRLRDHLEGLTRDRTFSGLTWFWGPALYERNRVLFRPLIFEYFSDWEAGRTGWKRVHWKDHADRLEPWLAAARKNRDSKLVRRLLRWKFSGRGWGVDAKSWNAALLADYRNAGAPAARAIVLDEYDDWFQLDEDTALGLYECDRSCRSFLTKHLPQSFWGDDKRRLWSRLVDAAGRAGDEALQFEIYRRQVPVKQWSADVLHLAEQITDASQLDAELERRHPQGYGLKLGSTLLKLLEARGRAVAPYVQRHLRDALEAGFGNKAKPIVQFAEKQGWWELWAAAIRADRNAKLFNASVSKLLADDQLLKDERLSRLRSLAGVSREWNWAGLGLAQVHSLDDEVASKLYERYPELIRGPFKPHVLPTWFQGFPKLLDRAVHTMDDDLVDALASRYATRVGYDHGYGKRELDRIMETAEWLADYYQAIRDDDPVEFARRAANVLTQIPTYSNYDFRRLLQTNKLARLLYVRSFDAFLSAPEAVRDLVEGSDIQVQRLAYRILALKDERAQKLAAESLDVLMGTLLRPLHRRTRLVAFDALENAARADASAAAKVLDRARQALRLPDKKYPKEHLVGLIGRILHLRPELQSEEERPVVYSCAEASS